MFLIFFSYLIIINALLILIDALKRCLLQSDPPLLFGHRYRTVHRLHSPQLPVRLDCEVNQTRVTSSYRTKKGTQVIHLFLKIPL